MVWREPASKHRLTRQYLGKGIQIPTLIVQPRDDPFATDAVIPQDEELSSAVRLELCDHGGHVGFVDGARPWAPRCWLEGENFVASRRVALASSAFSCRPC